MAQQHILWTALPHGYAESGRGSGPLRLSIVVSPRLTPQTAAEQRLGAPGFADFHNWPKTLSGLQLGVRIGNQTVPVKLISQPDPKLWETLLGSDTPVNGFEFQDMSRVNLRSFPVRHVLGFLREHYGNLAQQSATTHPTLLPWRQAHPGLKTMLGELGTRTHVTNFGSGQVETPLPGFDRFFGRQNEEAIEALLDRQVFSEQGKYQTSVVGLDGQTDPKKKFAVRVLPSDWQDPALGRPDAAVMSQFRSQAEYSFYQANRFYRRRPATEAEQRMRRPNFQGVPPAPKPPEYDFHRIIASYADTPQVLRALGLIIDVVLPKGNPIEAQLKLQAQVDGVLGVEIISWPGHNLNNDSYPRTAWRATKQRFVTRSRTNEHAHGLLALEGADDPTLGSGKSRSPFSVFQLDTDGAALKTVDYLLTAQNLIGKSLKTGSHGEVTYTTGDKQPVAALRGGGLGVAQHGRAAAVAMGAAAAALKNAAVTTSATESRKVVLFSEDVHRGHRVDVQANGKWHSLCARVGQYTVLRDGQPLDFKPDEGYVKGASTTGDGSDDHYLHESLFRWTGWSLVAPRPGRTIKSVEEADSGLQGESVQTVDEAAKTGNGLSVTFKAQPGTLPRLRFGWSYRFRARLTDLAGNSLAVNDPSLGDVEQATEAVPYLRFEPVDPPALVHAHRVSEGESLERLVIRSNANTTPGAYLQTPDFKQSTQHEASADFEYQATCERHVVPPKSSQLQCEQHGLLDDAFGSGDPVRIKAAYEVAAREAGTLYDHLPGSQIELVTPASVAASAQTKTVPPQLPNADHPTGERMVGGQYIVHREERVDTPYLPDGAAGGLAIRGLNREDMRRIGITRDRVLGPDAVIVWGPQEELVLLVKYQNTWPDTRGLRIVMAERQPAAKIDDAQCEEEALSDADLPKWDADQRVLTLFVRKGHIARLRYASFVDPTLIKHMGLPHWSKSSGEFQSVMARALMGMHWMMTPYRHLVLVHATQQPVCTPRLQSLQAPRQAGATHIDLQGDVQLHGPSTGKFEIEAEWDEWVDDLNQDAPRLMRMSGQLGDIPLAENHRNRFTLAEVVDAARPPAGNLGGGQAQRAPGNRHEFDDTRFRLVRYRIKATTRFREYLPPALYEQTELVTRTGPHALLTQAQVGADNDPGAPVRLNVSGAQPNGLVVPATLPPDAPRVVYTVPTFAWQRDLAPGKARQTSTRQGNGLRVYLDRPWFTSGNGEMLGVVLLSNGGRFTDIPEAMQPFVSQWGLDPLFDSSLPRHMARASDFAARVQSETVPLLETGQQVLVVGHRVEWDAQRKLWFCDIQVDPGVGYMPFVRLALVRYQPHAIGGAKVSRVVMSEFAQVLPRRHAVFEKVNPQQFKISLHGPVPQYGPMRLHNDSAHLGISLIPSPGTALEAGRNRVELVLQRRDPSIDSDLAWSDVSVLASGIAQPGGAPTDIANPGAFVVNAGSGSAASSGATASVAAPAASGGVAAKSVTSVSGTAVMRPDRLGQLHRFEPELIAVPPVFELVDPAIWTGRGAMPAASTAPQRLVLREYERYYADRTVPEKRGNQTLRRRVVEERLVYTEFIPL